jgi:hypothetical protein
VTRGRAQKRGDGSNLLASSASGCGCDGRTNVTQTMAAARARPRTPHKCGVRRRLNKNTEVSRRARPACGSACLLVPPAGSKGVLGLSLNVTCSGAEKVGELWEGGFLQERGGTMKQPNMQLALAYPCDRMRGGLLGEGGACVSDAPLRCGHTIGSCAQQRKGAALRVAAAAAPRQGGGGSVEVRGKAKQEGATLSRHGGVAREEENFT